VSVRTCPVCSREARKFRNAFVPAIDGALAMRRVCLECYERAVVIVPRTPAVPCDVRSCPAHALYHTCAFHQGAELVAARATSDRASIVARLEQLHAAYALGSDAASGSIAEGIQIAINVVSDARSA
jgi:hypothetical protein